MSLHVAVLLFGRGRGRFVGGREVGPVKRAETDNVTLGTASGGHHVPPPSSPAPLRGEKSCLHLPFLSLFLCPGLFDRSRVGGSVAAAAAIQPRPFKGSVLMRAGCNWTLRG